MFGQQAVGQEMCVYHGGDIIIPDDNRRGGGDNASEFNGKHKRTHMEHTEKSTLCQI